MPPISVSPYNSALLKPSFFSSSTRALPAAICSARSPKDSACAGQVCTHAGTRSWATRSSHRVHLFDTPKFGRNFGTPNGHATLQYLHPTHLVLSSFTVPLGSLLIAPTGQTSMHAGSVQWKQDRRPNAHSMPLSVSFSWNWI